MFAITSQTALTSDLQAVRSYLGRKRECELHTLTDTKVRTAKDHGENYMKVRPPLVCHLFHNRPFCQEDGVYLGTKALV